MRRAVLLALAVLALLSAPRLTAAEIPALSPPAGVAEETVRLAATIGGKDYALDALIVRRPGEGKLPVALITHGSSVGDPRGITLDGLRGWAHDLAHRGWLAVAVMRRGYGASEGEVAETYANCTSPDATRYLDAHADDLEAALRALARRPDADTSRVLAVGNSTGGATVLALAARPAAHVAAVVNISGGLSLHLGPFRPDPACTLFDSDLVWTMARFGRTARMPALWVYAENDSYFRPGLVARMQAAYTGSGGMVDLVMAPPLGSDGHLLFVTNAGRQRALAELDRFLRAHGLPTWDEGVFAPFLAGLEPNVREGVAEYLRKPSEKALALAPNGGVYWSMNNRQIADARTRALDYCRKQTGAECRIAVENFQPLDQAARDAPGPDAALTRAPVPPPSPTVASPPPPADSRPTGSPPPARRG